MLSRPADARVRARFRVGAKRGVFRGENGGGAGVFCTMAFGGKGGKAGGKTRKIRPSSSDLCSFGTLRGDLCKTVEKLCKSLQGVKTKNTNCAQRFVRLCVLVRELCKYRFLSAFGVWALWCGGAPFGRFPSRQRSRGTHLGGRGAAVDKLPRGARTGRDALLCKGASAFAFALPHPALGASPISGQGRGGRQVAAGRAHGQGRGLPAALPPLRTVIRHTSGMVRHCARGRPPLPSPSPTLRTAARDTVAQRCGHSPGAADGRTIYYIYACAGARARTFCTGRRATMWITFPWITHCG